MEKVSKLKSFIGASVSTEFQMFLQWAFAAEKAGPTSLKNCRGAANDAHYQSIFQPTLDFNHKHGNKGCVILPQFTQPPLCTQCGFCTGMVCGMAVDGDGGGTSRIRLIRCPEGGREGQGLQNQDYAHFGIPSSHTLAEYPGDILSLKLND